MGKQGYNKRFSVFQAQMVFHSVPRIFYIAISPAFNDHHSVISGIVHGSDQIICASIEGVSQFVSFKLTSMCNRGFLLSRNLNSSLTPPLTQHAPPPFAGVGYLRVSHATFCLSLFSLVDPAPRGRERLRDVA